MGTNQTNQKKGTTIRTEEQSEIIILLPKDPGLPRVRNSQKNKLKGKSTALRKLNK